MTKTFKPYSPEKGTPEAERKVFYDEAPGATFLEKIDAADGDDGSGEIIVKHATDMLLWGYHRQSPQVKELIGLAIELGSMVGLGSGVDAMSRTGDSD